MGRTFFLFAIGVIFCFNSFAQSYFYVEPIAGVVWNNYQNSNVNITGNENVKNIFWDNDYIWEIRTGFKFKNNLILESGVAYHIAADRYWLRTEHFSEISHAGGTTTGLFDGFLSVPLNLKYNFQTMVKNLSIVPYFGLAWSTHGKSTTPSSPAYTIDYYFENPGDGFLRADTLAYTITHRPVENNLLINYGLGIEYQILNRLIFTLNGNFTHGFTDMNRFSVNVLSNEGTESGTIRYRGNKFYLSGGVKIPFGVRQ